MFKKILVTLIIGFVGFAFVGCENIVLPTNIDLSTNPSTETDTPTSDTVTTNALSDYEIWLDSEEAFDYDGDRRINESDYETYLVYNDFDYWRASEEALDLNNDRKIDELDYEIFRLRNNYFYWESSTFATDLNDDGTVDELDHDVYINFDEWKNSDQAVDINEDELIDVSDYEVFQAYQEFVGDYMISNYAYDGPSRYGIGETTDNVKFDDLGDYLEQVTITINNLGEVSVTIPTNVYDVFNQFSGLMSIIDEAVENMSISRISPYIAVIDTSATVEGVEGEFTLYLDDIENGFSTSYVISFFETNPEISFDIIKVE